MATVTNSATRIRMLAVIAAIVFITASFTPATADEGDSPTSPPDLAPLEQIEGAAAPETAADQISCQSPEIKAVVEQARINIEDGELQNAVEILTKAAAAPDGDCAEIHYLHATALARLGRFNEALAPAQRAATLNHGDADSHYILARLYRGEGRIDDAVAHYRSATLATDRELNNPNVTRAWHALGQLLEKQNRPLAAAQAFAKFDEALWTTHPEQRNAPDIAALLHSLPYGMAPKRLELLRSIGRHDDALKAVESARSVWPDAPVLDREYARCLLDAGRAAEAFEFCRELIEKSDKSAVILPVAIEAAAATQRLDDWLDDLVARVLDSDQIEPRRQLLAALKQTGDFEQVARVGALLAEKTPDDEPIAWTLAEALQRTGRADDALASLIRFIRNSPTIPEIAPDRLKLWMSWFANYPNFGETVRKLRGDDADFATDFVLGVSALAADEPTLADELLQAGVEARPDFAPARVVRGEIMLADYQWEQALRFADDLLKQHPELPAALYLAARAREGLDQNEEAESAFKQTIKVAPEEPAYTLALAQHYRRLGELRGAQRYFQETLALASNNGEALEGLIDCYLRGGKIEIARAALERLDRDRISPDSLRRIDTLMHHLEAPFGPKHLADLRRQCEQYPEDIASARLLAGGLYFRGEIEQTEEVARKALARHPNDYHLTILIANVHSLRGEFEQACRTLTPLHERYPNRLAVLQPLALAELNAFQIEEGRALIRRLMELEPDDLASYRAQLLRSYVEFDECDEAVAAIDDWLEDEPENEDLARQKIALLIDCGRNDEAFEITRKRAEGSEDENNQIDYIAFGMASEHYEEAATALRELLEKNPANADMTEKLIEVLILAGKADEALETAKKFEGTYSESLRRRIWLGQCQAAAGDVDSALAEYDALLNERGLDDEQRRTVRFELINALIDAQRYDEGLKRCDQWFETAQTNNPLVKFELLQFQRFLLQSAGRDGEYIAVMETLMTLSPDDVGLMNDLAYSWVDAGMNIEPASRMLKQVTAAEPWNAAYLDSMGWAYYKAGDFGAARKYLARAVRLRAGRDPLVYDHLADAEYRLGDETAAREHWRQAVELIESNDAPGTAYVDTMTSIRAKLTALQRGARPETAPTATEQNDD